MLGVTTALTDVDLAGINAKVSKCLTQALAAVLQQVAGEWVVGTEDGIEFAVFHFKLDLYAAQVGGAQCKLHLPFAIAELLVHASGHFGGHFVAQLVIDLAHVGAGGLCGIGRVGIRGIFVAAESLGKTAEMVPFTLGRRLVWVAVAAGFV